MPDVPAVGLFLGAPLFHALDALVQLLQQVRILFRLAERLDKRQRKLHIRDGGNGGSASISKRRVSYSSCGTVTPSARSMACERIAFFRHSALRHT